MSRPTSTRRRLSLLASSSLAVASLMAGVGGVVALAPSQALAANECGDPSANAGGDDVLVCNGAYATGIDYTATTDGNIVLLLVDTITIPDGGIRVTGAAGEGVGVSSVTGIVDGGDINVTNIGGIGIDLSGTAANVTLNIFETDAGDGVPFVSGTSGGIRVRTTAGFDGELNIEGGTVDGGAGWGLSNVVTGGGEASIDYGDTAVSGATGVRALSATGTASVTGTGTVNSTGAGYGVLVGGGAGGATLDISGTVTAADIGVRVQATGGGTATATVGDITAVGVGLEISAINGGDAIVLGTGAVSGATGISAVGNAVTGGNVSVTTGGAVTGTAGDGITATSAWDGNTTIDASAGLVTATGNGVSVTTFDGDGDITVGDVNAGQYGVVGSVTGAGNMTVTVTGAVVGGTAFDFDGVDIDTGAGTATFNLNLGGSVDTQGATAFGVDIDTQGGNIIAQIDGDILGGGLGANVNAGAGTVGIYGGGAIDGGAYQAIVAGTVDGDLTINVSGALTGAQGVEADVSGTGNANVTVGAVNVTGDGIDVDVASGTATVTTNGAVIAGGTGISVDAGGTVVVNVNDDVTATVSGITATSTTGSSTVTVAAGVTIDPEDYGISDVAATDATVTTGDSVSIIIDNSTDNDAIAVGVFAQSGAAADTAALDPSVEVTLGTNNSITLLPGGVTDGGAGIWAENNGGGTGSVSIITGDGTLIDAQGDNTVGVYASTNTGAIDITLGTGRSWVYAGDGADGAGNFDVSAGIRAQSSGGNITINSNADVQAASAGAIEGMGIYASTTGAGTVDITTGASSYTWGTDYGIGVNAGSGAVTIETNGAVQSNDGEAIFVNGGAGTIEVTNNSTVTSGGAAAIEIDGTGVINVNANANVQGLGGIDVDGDTGVVTIAVASGVTVTGTAGTGIIADTSTGDINVDLTGSVTATGVGVDVTSTGGVIDVDLLGGSVTGSSGIVTSNTTGVTTVIGLGNVTGTAGDAVSSTSTTGDITISTFDSATGTVNGLSAVSGSGVVVVSSGTLTTGGTGDGMIASTGGAGTATAVLFGTISGVNGVNVETTGAGLAQVQGNGAGVIVTGTAGDGIVITSGSGGSLVTLNGAGGSIGATGGDGVDASSTTGDVTVTGGWTITATGVGVLAASGGGDIVVNNTGGASIAGGTGGIAATTSGPGTIDIDTTGAISGAAAAGIFANTTGTGLVTVDTLNDVSGTVGIDASGGGVVNVTSSGGTITTTAGSGIVTSAGAATTVNNSDAINATGGVGISASAVNAVSVTNSGAIAGTAVHGIVGNSTGATAAGVFINNTGAVGSGVNGVDGFGVVAIISNAASTGNITVFNNADVYSDTHGVGAQTFGLGNITVNVGTVTAGTTRGAGGYGVFGVNTNAASTGTVEINIGANSVIEAGVGGVYAANAGTGASTITIGDGVSIDPDDFGVQASGAGEQNIVLGNNVVVDINNTDGDATAVGLWASSTAAADVAVGDPTVEITVGTGLVITVDDGFGGEADGGAGILAQTVGTASSHVVVGDGLSITLVGDSSVGIGATSVDGDIEFDIGTGTINVAGGNGVDSAGNYPGSAGIGAISDGGSIDIFNNANIILTNGPGLDASGIHGSTTGAGEVTITSNGTISSSDVGINAESVDGAIQVNQNGVVTATNVGVQADATGTGSVTVASTASVTATTSDGINAQSNGGAVTVTTVAGTTITAGDDGITALVNGGAANVTVTNDAAINANTFSGGGYGVYAWNSGTGDTIVGNTGAIDGLAVYGLVAGANTGTVDVDNSGAIGSAGNPVAQDGIYGYVAGGAGNVSITNLATGVIWAGSDGIFAFAGGTGSVGVSNAAAIGGSATTGIFAQAAAGPVTVLNAGAIGSNGDNVASDGIFAEVQSGTNTLFVQNIGAAIWADGSGIVANNDGDGILTVLNSGVVNAGASGISADSSGGVSTVTNSAAITAGNDGIQSFNTGAGTITVTNSAAITASSDGIDTNGGSGATLITNSGAITTANDTGIEADSGSGAITVNNNAGGVISANGDGIRASAAGAGAVTVTTAATVTSATADGIEANSAGGAIIVTNNAVVSAPLNGILTTNSGGAAATTVVNANANISSGSVAATAAINAGTTGTGLVDVNVANGVTLNGGLGSGIRTASGGGAVTVDIGSGGAATTVRGNGIGATSWVLDLNNAAGGTTTVNIASNATVRSHDATVTGYDDLAIRGIGGSVVVNNAGRLNGRVNFAGLTGNVVFNNTSGLSWHTTGASVFSGGADVLNNTAAGAIFTNSGGVATSWDFGAGADTFTQAGLLVVGEPAQGAATLTITNLEAWNNSGSIAFGSSATTLAGANSDGFINDRIVSTGTTFTGSGSSRLFMDANLGAVTQTSCAVLAAADCFDLTGGSTAGSTTIRFNDVSGNVFGAFNPTGIVVVDVTGAGATAATHFSLLAGQPFWRADLNSADGVLDKGLFFYDLTLDGKQHKLVGLPDGEAFEFTTVGQAAQAAWYTTTGTWFDRQADLRDQLEDSEAGAGIWMKITGSAADRDLISSYELFGVTYNFDTSYDQQTISVIGGIDFIGSSTADSQWLIGGMIGYVDSDVNFDASPTMASMEGLVIGAYGTFVNKGWFVDGVVAGNMMDLDYQATTLAPAPNNIYASEVNSWGFQVEGGYSFPLGASAFLEPLASLSYVRTEIDAIDVPGATIDWDDQTSLRGSLGARIGANAAMDTFDAKFSLTGRIWNEFEGENELTIHSAGPDLGLTDDFSGSFGEVSGSINLFSNKAAFSAFLNAGVKFKEDYQSTDATLGFRWRW